ncbi:MAG: 30S ribosomal protein S7 [Rickettsia sp.]|nr:30S ribosomal protein S7 [Rickettsia sp.]
MSRRVFAVKRNILPDYKYGLVVLSRFINNFMKSGNKFLAEKFAYKALDLLEKKHGLNSEDAFCKAIENVKPNVEVKPVRIGGATYQVPVLVADKRSEVLAIKWIINAAKSYSGNSIYIKIAESLFDAYNKRGAAYKKREDIHKMAESNKAFAHFAQKRVSKVRESI